MDGDWALLEYRPGRYAKVTPEGRVIEIATEEEARAWFALQSRGESDQEEHRPDPLLPAGFDPLPSPELAKMPTPPRWMSPDGEGGLDETPAEDRSLRDRQVSRTKRDVVRAGNTGEPASLPSSLEESSVDRETQAAVPGRVSVASETPGDPEESGIRDIDANGDVRATRPLPDMAPPESAAPVLADSHDPVPHTDAGVPKDADGDPVTVQQPSFEGPTVEKSVQEEDWNPDPEESAGPEGLELGFDEVDPDRQADVDDRILELEEHPGSTDWSPDTVEGEWAPPTGEAERVAAIPAQSGHGAELDDDLLSRPLEAAATISELSPTEDSSAWWLWVDPKRETGYLATAFDTEGFLRRAISHFQSKAWSGGMRPARLAVNPDLMTKDLAVVAGKLDLELVPDIKVTPGTYMLGLADRTPA